MRRVEVDRRLLIGLGATAAAACLAVMFLLGRESARSAAAPAQAIPAPAGTAQVALPADPPAPLTAAPESAPAPAAPQVQPPQRPAAGAAAAARPAPDPMPAAVAAYFQAIDRLQPGQLGGDPESVAKGIVAGLGKGDSSGIDDLLRQSEATRARLAALTPPGPCAAYHQESLAVLDASLDMLRSLRTALASGNADSAAGFAAQAGQLKARTERLQADETALRARFGVAP